MSEDIRAEAGFLILADISGFTAFVAGTELEHGALVTGVLLEAVHADRLGEVTALIAYHWEAANEPYQARQWRERAAS